MSTADQARPARIADVASAAGVSRATVSRVMNARSTVDPVIAERVREAAARLDYRPSELARNLSLGRTHTVAVVVPDLGNPMFQAILRGVTRAAAEDGYRVLVGDTQEQAGAEPDAAVEARRRCDALILCAPRMSAERLDGIVGETGPVALVNRIVDADGVPQVAMDYGQAVNLVVDHLAGLGHRHLVYLGGPVTSASNRLRIAGLDIAEQRHPQLRIDRRTIGSSLDDGWSSAESVLESGATGVVAFNDLTALGLLSRLRELGVGVPEQLSVVGVDDIPYARFSEPTLTTVSVPQDELGVQTWRRLRLAIDGLDVPGPLWLEGGLRVRASSGPAPR
ncbi:LacI family transcriptional regulator [Rathayibacter sp. PhB152]|uniref:LacI family DNA-binding transcriptional regulator n=1 Tax=Rathayibacter sp. PhB152 TaxID=2485190 RepID=UPI000F4C62E1|nr:LacI family DNA-binding transcriptional regulator [Rathayibacter sp. PhB152]ROQ64155.1 LacI family transcriptional regulator [Rathayibacter sp. PhB152]